MAYGKTKRDRVEQERTGGTGFWKPADGENRIRLLPPWDENMDQFWFRTGTHFNVGPDEKWVPCPEESAVSDSCFLCRLAKRLSKGDEDERDEAEAIDCRPAFLVNIVDYAHIDDGVQVWRCGITAFRQIRKLWLNDDEYGDMTDLDDGYDILVTKEGSGINTKYDVMPARNNSRFPTKKMLEHSSPTVAALYATIDDQTFELPNLSEAMTFVSDEEMEAIYKGTSGRRERVEDEDKPRSRRRDNAVEEEEKNESKAEDAESETEQPRNRRSRADGNEDAENGKPTTRTRRAATNDGEDEGKPKTGSSRVRARVRDLD